VNQYLPLFDSYCRVVWPIVISIWLFMGIGDVRNRIRPKGD
jgi:hypothetical protein